MTIPFRQLAVRRECARPGGGTVLAGVSAILPALPPEVIVELPIRAGPIWVTIVPEPALLPLAAGGAAVFLGLTRRRK